MLKVNDQELEWREGLTFRDILKFLGYRDESPLVVTRVNGILVKALDRNSCRIPDESIISVLNILQGG